MKILLDTHTFLWWSMEPDNIPLSLLDMMKSPDNSIFLSVVSSWEAQIKMSLGKLVLEESLRKILEQVVRMNRWEILPVTLHHTWALADLPPFIEIPLIAC